MAKGKPTQPGRYRVKLGDKMHRDWWATADEDGWLEVEVRKLGGDLTVKFPNEEYDPWMGMCDILEHQEVS